MRYVTKGFWMRLWRGKERKRDWDVNVELQ